MDFFRSLAGRGRGGSRNHVERVDDYSDPRRSQEVLALARLRGEFSMVKVYEYDSPGLITAINLFIQAFQQHDRANSTSDLGSELDDPGFNSASNFSDTDCVFLNLKKLV